MSGDDNSLFDDILGEAEIELTSSCAQELEDVIGDLPNINERACLSILQRHDTRMTRAYDEDTQQELREAAGDNSLTANKKLFRDDKSPVRKLIRKSNQLYAFHKDRTLDSGTVGKRVLDLVPKKDEHVFTEFAKEMNERIDEISRMFETELAPQWGALVDADVDYRSQIAKADPDPVSRQRKLDRISRHEYPTVEEAREQFRITWLIDTISEESAIAKLAKASPAAEEKLRGDLSQIISGVEMAARSDLAERMLRPITRAVDKLKVPVGEKGSVFRDSLINNLGEQLAEIEELAIVDDDNLRQAIAKARSVINTSMPGHEALRTSQQARDKAVQQLNDLAATFDGLR
jgi:hypothetical protein